MWVSVVGTILVVVFAVTAALSFMEATNDLQYVTLKNGSAQARVSVYAAHVTHFTVDGKDVLFLSRKAIFSPPKAIRGGIPLIWPQFGQRGPLAAAHGFARNAFWTVVRSSESSVTLELRDTEELRKIWPHRFHLRYTVSVTANKALELDWEVHALDDMSFTCALHTYFSVSDISKVRVEGLRGTRFQDHLQNMKVEEETRDFVTVAQEVDRTYLQVGRVIRLHDDHQQQVVRLTTSPELADAVVWNPWIEKSIKMSSDFGADEYLKMICIEVGVVEKPVILSKGAVWKAKHEIAVEDQVKSNY